MCAIMGAVGQSGALELGLPWLRRRGPDGYRVWSSTDGCVKLMHCRLAIVDTDPRADQPFHDSERGITVALNGEIYNYRNLRRELADYSFRTESDTEVVLAAYVVHGLDGFRHLQGMFAFTLVDEKQRRIYLVRDAVGKKPLFVHRASGNVSFGSSVLPLIACAGGGDIDPKVVPFFWKKAFISADTSAILGAQPISPGTIHELDWQGRTLSVQRCEPEATLLFGGESRKEVLGNIAGLLATAIDRRLENNSQPVVLLSGGIDSTVVTSVAQARVEQRFGSVRLKALTLGAFIPYSQDEFYARYAARRLGVDLQIVSIAKGRLIDAIRRALSVQDEPLGMPSYFFLHQMVEAAAQHGRVLLTGDGGDEVFLGYRPPAEWRSQSLFESEPALVKVGPGPASWMGSWARDVTGNTLLGHMFAKADRASAEQGVEMRCPLLDWSLMSYVRSLPYELVAGNGRLKPLLKDQLSQWPSWFLERRKLGFAFNLRWRWALSRFDGLRETVRDEAIDTFGDLIPCELRRAPRLWTSKNILTHFSEAWRLMVWSAFLDRVTEATESDLRAPGYAVGSNMTAVSCGRL